MREPMISVIMPVYNGEKYLPEAIESILNQTYKNFEFIIINDGSTDRTEEIILSYKDDRIIYVKNEKNLQIVESLNKGINLAKGKYIARMDADDISLPKRLEKQIEFMEKNTHVGVCGTWMKTFGEKNEVWKMPISHDEIVVSMLFNSCIMHPTAVIRTKVLKENNLYYDQKYNKVEDYELWTRLVKYTQFANIPEILLKYRIFENDSSRKSYKEQQKKLSNLVRQNYLKSLGIDFTEKELVVHNKISNYEYDYSSIFAYDAMLWFNKLINFIEHDSKNIISNKKMAKKIILKRAYLVFSELQDKLHEFSIVNNFFQINDLNINLNIKMLVKFFKGYF